MPGLAGYGNHASHCTLVHYEGEEQVYDYCLGCRMTSLCTGFYREIACGFPVARLSEEASRDPSLMINCDHPAELWRHYQEPGYAPSGDWSDTLMWYHYCTGCLAATTRCPEADPLVVVRRQCQTLHTPKPFDDSARIGVAWSIAQVEGEHTPVHSM